MKGSLVKVKITKRVLNKLRAHKKRTGIGAYTITKGRKEAKPAGLNGKSLSDILNGKSHFIIQEHLDYILARYEASPDKQKSVARNQYGSAWRRAKKDYKLLSEQDLKKLRHYRELGFIPSWFLKTSPPPPKGFNSFIISGWLGGHSKTAKQIYLQFVFEECEKLETNPQKIIVIDEQLLSELRAHKERTGHGGTRLLKFRNDMPGELGPGMINSWLSGGVKTARADYIRYVISRWERTPEHDAIGSGLPQDQFSGVQRKSMVGKTAGAKRPLLEKEWTGDKKEFDKEYPVEEKTRTVENKAPAPNALIVITHDMHQQLMVHNQQARISGAQLLKNAKNVPQGLRAEMIDNWINEHFKTARKDHWAFVMTEYRNYLMS